MNILDWISGTDLSTGAKTISSGVGIALIFAIFFIMKINAINKAATAIGYIVMAGSCGKLLLPMIITGLGALGKVG